MTENSHVKIAVIGIGAQGLVTVKNLLEEGFDVTGFEKNTYVGGIWHYSVENRLSVLPTTTVNASKERASFTDFPYPDDCDSYPTSKEVEEYLNDYCDHFKLRPHLRLGTTITAVDRDATHNKWTIAIKSGASTSELEYLSFDKLIIATGPHCDPIEPVIPGRDKFKGEILHSVTFKDRQHFAGKRVLVLGASNTAADTCTSLIDVASKVYFSHRNGSLIVPRYLKNGTALDHGLTYRISTAMQTLGEYAPNLAKSFMSFMTTQVSLGEFGQMDPSWKLTPFPSMLHQVPTVSDNLIPALRSGTVTSTAVPRQVIDDYEIELEDGEVVEVDAMIFCTGYNSNFGFLGKHDPTLTPEGTHDCYTPRLYQNILSLDYPDSLAFVGLSIVFIPAFLMSDLSTMALAQLWSTKVTSAPMPSSKEMHEWHLQHVRWATSVRATHPARKMVKFSLPDSTWTNWVQTVAGTNVQEHLSWTNIRAWRFWWNDREFCNLLMGGVFTSVCYRLFESDRRKKWDGAREAIEKINDKVKQDVEKRRKAASEKKVERGFVDGR